MRHPRRERAVRLAVLLPTTVSLLVLSACTSDEKQAVPTSPGATSASPPMTTTSRTSTTSTTRVRIPTAPLTGISQPDAQLRSRSVVAVKIDNDDLARPQEAVDQADLVFEEPVEGGITRLMAVYQSANPKDVGPVRSARVTDVSILRAMGGGALVYSGSSRATHRRIAGTPNVHLVRDSEIGSWHRDSSRRAPHNLIVDQSSVRTSLGNDLNEKPQRQFNYAGSIKGGSAIKQVRLSWQSTSVTWNWNRASMSWQRRQNGSRDVQTNGKIVATDNVVVLQVRTRTDPGLHDVNGFRTPLPDLQAGGRMWLLRDGKVYGGTWDRAGVTKPLTFKGTAGKKIGLRPGTTWVELLPRPAGPKFS
jgi:hypothetical protein